MIYGIREQFPRDHIQIRLNFIGQKSGALFYIKRERNRSAFRQFLCRYADRFRQRMFFKRRKPEPGNGVPGVQQRLIGLLQGMAQRVPRPAG